ncbi:PAS domain S-box-containing protein [Halorubrum xinjiangense]|uniref:histidine kinase n=1 Tax=Halorubrum xinjiangense TaxID=261291 RepID=A0A1G7RF74_9EURY|nr:PAS domain S-box protein [Halorubrum xinjiangense]SDG09413.1 PAS domain S-box-containing protein [Halorubrum xinjiangense]
MESEINVLHVDDDPSITDLTASFLKREDDRFRIQTATSAGEGLSVINDCRPDCIVSDFDMPNVDGIEFLQSVRKEFPTLPFILFTGKGSEAVASDAIAADVTDYLQKGSGPERYKLLSNRICNAVEAERKAERADRQEQLIELTERTDSIGSFELNTETRALFLTNGLRNVMDLPDQGDPSLDDALDLFHPDDRKEIQQAIDSASQTGEQIQGSYRVETLSGERRIIGVTLKSAATGEHGKIVYGAVRDITDRRERQQELREYGTIIDALTDPVYVISENGRFTHVNDEFVELVGYERETIIGATPSLIKDDDAVEQAEQQLGRLLSAAGPETVTFEVTIHPSNSDPITCEDHMGVLPYDGDTFDGSVGVLRDVTERKEYKQGLEAQNERLEEFSKLVSHDLRNPLSVAEGHLGLVQVAEGREHLDTAINAIERSQALIDDLLTLAQEGAQQSEIETIDLAEAAKSSWETVETPQASLSARELPKIKADRSRLQQLLENLYRNSIEHGGEAVTVSVGATDSGFYVADNGVGIPESKRTEIFEAGYSTSADGTGFGLQIVEQVAKAHGWVIAVSESEQGGTRFEFTSVEGVN